MNIICLTSKRKIINPTGKINLEVQYICITFVIQMKKPYSIRIEEEIIEQLKIIAAEENRTVANLIETALKQYIDQSKK